MEIRHDDAEIAKLESDPEYRGRYEVAIVRAIRKVLQLVRGVKNETGLYQWRSLRFEKLKGNRSHQRSMRLNDQWRLIVEIEQQKGGNIIVVKGVEDYH